MEFKYKCLIVDDEAASHTVLKNYFSYVDNLELVGHKFNVIEAINFVHETPVDLVFLDINMPQFKGFELFKILSQPPDVIVVTAHSEYALTGFEVGVIDYLLKPVEFQRFLKAVGRFIHSKQKSIEAPAVSAVAGLPQSIAVKVDSEIVQIPINDISYIKSMGNYVKLNTDTKSYLCTTSTIDLEKRLPPDKFIRVHKSFIVAINKVQKFSDSKVYINGVEIPVGITYLRKLDSMFKN